jgi:hypothetical protein
MDNDENHRDSTLSEGQKGVTAVDPGEENW